MPSFLYPRTISVRRPSVDKTVGEQPYGGLLPTNEKVIVAGIPAHIQIDRQGVRPAAGLPGDALRSMQWKIIFKGCLGQVQNHDIIVDDLGNRYQVIAAYWGPMTTTCLAELLET